MNDDYLWDKSGEPDKEVQQLEELLAPLGYQAAELRNPEAFPVQNRRNYFPLLAVAATLIVALLTAGIWLRFHAGTAQPSEARTTKPGASSPNGIVETPRQPMSLPKVQTPGERTASIDHTPRKHSKRYNNLTIAALRRKRERDEGLAAKQQLLMALRLASEKLNLAQKKAQTPATANQIRNQHKIS